MQQSDYNNDAAIAQKVFKTVQDKLHWAITGKTAAELIADRADAAQPNMGLTTWKNVPKVKILKTENPPKIEQKEKKRKHLQKVAVFTTFRKKLLSWKIQGNISVQKIG